MVCNQCGVNFLVKEQMKNHICSEKDDKKDKKIDDKNKEKEFLKPKVKKGVNNRKRNQNEELNNKTKNKRINKSVEMGIILDNIPFQTIESFVEHSTFKILQKSQTESGMEGFVSEWIKLRETQPDQQEFISKNMAMLKDYLENGTQLTWSKFVKI